MIIAFEPQHEKIGFQGFRPDLTQTGLYNHRRRLEAWNFLFKKRDYTIHSENKGAVPLILHKQKLVFFMMRLILLLF